MTITYQREDHQLDPSEFIDLLVRSTLGERRPIDQPERIQKMCQTANLIITARDESGRLIGVARSISDFAYCTYLSDLAVDQAIQQQGIGKTLVEKTKAAAPKAKLILLAAPAAVDYYPRIGMQAFAHCFTL